MYHKHGRSKLPEYQCWSQIKQRCLNPKHRQYPNYGGRGITIHEPWQTDFEAFYAYVGPRPSPQHSLDRIENNKGYVPGNLRWATSKEQNRNRRPYGTGTVTAPATPGRTTNFRHGLIDTPEYKAWVAMKDRCLNPKSSNYAHWGGRGVTVYEPWQSDFLAFYAHLGPKPTPQHSLDRWPDPNGNYEPGNVRWASKSEQNRNRRPTITGPEHGNFDHGGLSGGQKTPEYKVWGSVKTRCFNPKYDRYADYGGRGITMCAGWRDSFATFLADVGPKPDGCNLARSNHDGHYSCGKCPECVSHGWSANCRWAPKSEQNRNRRTTRNTGKLTAEKVATMRERLHAGASQQAVATEFDVCRSLVGKIARGESWAP